MDTKRKVTTQGFLETHPVFSLDEAEAALAPPGGRPAVVERLKHHLGRGRLLRVAREVYAVVPAGVEPERFRPDPFLVARALRPDAIFAYHSAFELLGSAHSVWNRCVAFTDRRRPDLVRGGVRLRFVDHPAAFRDDAFKQLGTRQVERGGRLLRVTGPERTLVEGFRRPGEVGGFEELIHCAAASATLDLELLAAVLARYDEQVLRAAVGWFLERFQAQFHVPERFLEQLEAGRPASPRYLRRSQRGGTLASRWNLILPAELGQGEPDET